MLSYVCLLLAVLGAANSADSQPSRCCFDSKFTAMIGVVGAVAEDATQLDPIYGSIDIAYDYDQKLIGTSASMTQPDGQFKTTVQLRDYRDRRIYTYVDNTTCTYRDMENMDMMYSNCVPDNATFTGPATVGYGAQTIRVNNWETSVPLDDGTLLIMILSVSSDNCVPIMESITGTFEGKQVIQTFHIFNYQPGIDPQNALSRPTVCTAESTDPAVGRR